jgi:polyhydroxyalkanoate synthase
VLSNSGHIQSILNPPGNLKASYLENDKLPSDPRAWYFDTQKHDGSWWPGWLAWIQARSGEQRETLLGLGNQNYPPMETAPGTYVQAR